MAISPQDDTGDETSMVAARGRVEEWLKECEFIKLDQETLNKPLHDWKLPRAGLVTWKQFVDFIIDDIQNRPQPANSFENIWARTVGQLGGFDESELAERLKDFMQREADIPPSQNHFNSKNTCAPFSNFRTF